jgi:2-dehydro-3-deoxyphosphogluconate aldolase/(4S)-4-hydroxy-2-oxoglutarate aldolase
MKKENVLAQLHSCGLVAVVRAKDAEDAKRIGEACIKGGCAGIELTFTTPGITSIIETMAKEYEGSDFIIGAGTVMDPETARLAILSGAQYVVSPYFNADTVRLCNRYRVACMPGAMSISEVVAGMEAGADIIKVFPGELFGPKIIKAIHGPIPYAQIMPTGGVSVDNVGEWIKAGAVAVGAGGSLTAGAKTGDYAKITETARQFIEKIRAARAGE